METEGRRQFRIGRCLGRGGFGEVYRATMRSPGGLETVVALKVLSANLKEELETDALARLRDEGRVLARVTHPAVVRAHDLVEIEGRLALVTEFVEGDDLDRCFEPPDPIGPKALLQVAAHLAVALDAAFSTPGPDGRPLELVHRDVKPSNVRLGRHGQVKLLDFGIARFSAPDREVRTQSDIVMGSIPYMAPERFEREHRTGLPASDVFGLGCIVYEGLAGGRRFYGDARLPVLTRLVGDAQRYTQHLEERLVALPVPPEVAGVVGRCLAHEPQVRPVVKDLAIELETLAESLPGPALRRWCADRAWPEPPVFQGELEGRTVTEGTLGLGPDGAEVDAKPLRPPEVNQRPLGTLDPSMFGDAPSASPTAGRLLNQAPAAFPSIPIGIALEELTGEARDLALSKTPPALPERSTGRGTTALVAGVGCVLALLLGGLAVGSAGVALAAWMAL